MLFGSNGSIGNVGGGSGDGGIYDGIDTEANILASDPTVLLGQTWWASDTKGAYEAVTDIGGTDVWQAVTPQYDTSTDSFCFPATQDGQTQNVGQEVFILSFNGNGTGADTLNPKVFAAVGSKVGEEVFASVLKVVSADLAEGSIFGINTTDLQPGGYGKLTTYGEVKGINTSAWNLGDTLYVDPDIPGDLTNVQPGINAFNIAKVLKVDPTEGIIFVNSITSNRIDSTVTPVGSSLTFFTGETDVLTAGTFYRLINDDPGTVATETEDIIVPDNSIVGIGQDHISDAFPVDLIVPGGLKTGQIEFEISSAGGGERIYFEIYVTDNDGTIIDSGITGQPVGTLGQRTVLVMQTTLLDTDANTSVKEEVRGEQLEDFILAAGNRFRVHILCEKVGSAGGNKTFTCYFGNDHSTFIEVVSPITFDSLTDTPESKFGMAGYDVVVNSAGTALEYTTDRVKWLYPWVDGTYQNRTMTRIGSYTTIANKLTSDYPAPTPVGTPEYLMDAAVFSTSANTSVVYSGHRYQFTEAGTVTQVRVQVPVLSGTTNYRVVLVDDTDPLNPSVTIISDPILDENGWAVVSVGSVIVTPGSDYYVYIDALDSGSSSGFVGGWRYDGGSNSAAPSAEGWNRSNNNTTIRVDKTDLDTIDRSTELAGVVAGSTLQFVDTLTPANFLEYETTGAPVDQGTYFEYPTQLVNSGGSISVSDSTTLTATIPVPSSTQYKQELGFWTGNDPEFANVTGFLEYDGVPQPGNDDTGFGVDIRFQKLNQSPDWDIVSISGVSGSGGGGVEEAPIDGTPYVRQDAAWVSESGGSLPDAISDLAASSGDREQSNLTWTSPSSPSPLTGYEVEYKLSVDSTWSSFLDVSEAAVSQIIYNLTAAAYDFRVAAVNGNGSAPWSNVAIGTPIAIGNTLIGLYNEETLSGTGAGMTWPNGGTFPSWDFVSTFGGTPANLTQATKKGKTHANTLGDAGLQTSSPSLLVQPYTHIYTFAASFLDGDKRTLCRDSTGAGVSDVGVSSTYVDMFANSSLVNTLAMPSDGTEAIVIAEFNGGSSSLRVILNDGSTDVTVNGDAGPNSHELTTMFWRDDLQANRDFIGNGYETRIYDDILDAGETQAVVGAFKQKWWSGFPYQGEPGAAPDDDINIGAAVQTVNLPEAASSTGLTTGQVHAVSFFLSERAFVNGLDLDVQGSASGDFHVGIYEPLGATTYNLVAQGTYVLSGETGEFISVDFDAEALLEQGTYMAAFLNPQTGGGNPSLYYAPITSSVTRHAFVSQEVNQESLPNTITIQGPLSNMFWAGVH